MKSLFTLFMLAALVLTQGTSLAASICQHASVQDHIAARQSHDSRKAAVAFAEEAAGDAASKNGSTSGGSSMSPLVALLPPAVPAPMMVPNDHQHPRAADEPPLAGIALRPPLPPPLA